MANWRSSAAYRIGLAYSAVVALGITILGLIAYWSIHVAFTRQIDSDIVDEIETLQGEYRTGGARELADAIVEREAIKSSTRLMYAAYDRAGHRTMGTFPAPRPGLGVHDISFTGSPGDDNDDGADEARVIAVDLAPDLRLLVAADRDRIESIDTTVVEIFAAGFAAVCLLGLAGGVLFGGYLRGRLRSISSSAEAIIGGRVGERMPVGPNQDEFDQLAVTLNRMLARIEGLLDNLRQVSSDVAHDLRTPLARLRYRLERAVAETETDTAARVAVEEALGQVDEVLRLFSAILRIAEVESGETRKFFAEIDLSQIIDDLVESYAPSVRDENRELRSDIERGVHVVGDRELLAQAAANLIENAQRHTPPGTTITMRLWTTADAALVEVADDGPGVPRADWARMTERFKRLDRSRTTEGYGLGLNLVAAVARLHGGDLSFRDADPGLAAIIELPRRLPTLANGNSPFTPGEA